MKTSDFQFSTPMLSELEFYVNNDYESESGDIDVSVKMQVNKSRIAEREAVVELTVEIGQKDKSAPFYIRAIEGAFFRWTENAFNGEQAIDSLLDVNAPALLVSYLRPLISGITTSSKYPTYNIPFINFNASKEES